MILAIGRKASLYQALAAIVVKQFLAYPAWFWVRCIGQILSMTIFVSFWRALYAGKTMIANLPAAQGINYILLAQVLLPVVGFRLILDFGTLVREGRVATDLLRPLDLQTTFYITELTNMLCNLLFQVLPAGIVAWLFFDLRLPSNPLVWLAFVALLLLGHAAVFLFDWSLACCAFYMTETWGLYVLRTGVALFFSGALVPLALFPGWLQSVAAALPFSQALYVPVSLLCGMTSLSLAPRLLVEQLAWLAGLGVVARLVFRASVRKVTVQGG